MKRLLPFLVVLSSTVCAQDELFSLYFESNIAEGLIPLTDIEPDLFERYELTEDEHNALRVAAGDYIVIDETGIYKEKNSIMTIPKAEIRENSTYTVRNGYLFGVVENDSLPCTLDGEHYLFLKPSKTYLFDPLNPTSKLFKLSDSDDYLLLSKEANGHYSGMMFSFAGSGLDLKEVNLSCAAPVIKSIRKKREEKGEIPTWFISPDKGEWTELVECFFSYDAYEVMAQ